MNTSLAGIRNLLFDLGGVIINLDRQRCVDALTALGDEKAAYPSNGEHSWIWKREKYPQATFSSACAKR